MCYTMKPTNRNVGCKLQSERDYLFIASVKVQWRVVGSMSVAHILHK